MYYYAVKHDLPFAAILKTMGLFYGQNIERRYINVLLN